MSAPLTRIETTRFGAVEVASDAIIQFPRGLYGLESARAYCLLPHQAGCCFQWLQAADVPATAMLVTDPFLFFGSYEIEIPDPAAALLQATDATEVAIYAPVTVSADRRELYANLLGPIVINPRAGVGMQLIQDGTRYSTRHPIGGREPSRTTEPQPAAGARERLPLRAAAGTSA